MGEFKNEDGIYEFYISPSYERYYSNETYYGVYEFATDSKIPHVNECAFGESNNKYLGMLAGNTGKLEYGVDYKVTAELEFNQKYKNWQYKPVEIVPIVPTTLDQSKKFLRSIITDNQTNALLDKYPNIIDMIVEKQEIDLTGIKGIREKTFEKIKDKIQSSYGMMELTTFLNPLGVSLKAIEKLFDGNASANVIKQKIKENPYIITKINGFGFKRADGIALKINPDLVKSKPRTEAFIKFLLKDVASKHGHTWVNTDRFLEECRKNIPECKEFIFELLRDTENKWLYVDRERKRIGLRYFYNLEDSLADEIIRLRDGNGNFVYGNVDEKLNQIQKIQGWNFTEEQLEGIKKVIESQCIAVTGYGGTGKTSIVNAIATMLDSYRIAQVALSGKAALRLQEVTNKPSSTIHRMLRFQDGKFLFDKYTKAPYDIVIIDEASMIGTDLFYDLLQAIPTGAKVIIMGDIGQLESIGVGSVFKDILESGVIPVVNLTQIHRQAQKSAIITESINIRKQKHIIDKDFYGTKMLGELNDLYLDISGSKDETADTILKYFKKEYNNNPDIMEIQIVVPMKERGESCTYKLNNKIQDLVNPSNKNKMEVNMNIKKGMPYVIRVGDKVMNMTNQYGTLDIDGNECPVFNGNIGMVKAIYSQEMIIDFIGVGTVVVPKDKWKSIELGYASTCHKMQGSEFKTVIVGVDSSSYVMLSKEWLYTAITRAKKMCYLVGDNYAIRTCVSQSKLVRKLTYLKEFLLDKTYNKLNNK